MEPARLGLDPVSLVPLLVLLEGLVLLRLGHVRLVLGKLRRLGADRLRLEAAEVRQDHLQEVHDAAALWEHALVGLAESLGRVLRGLGRRLVLHEGGGLALLGLLDQRRGLRRPGVEVLQDDDRVLDGLLGGLGVPDGLLVLGLGRSAVRRRLGHLLLELGDRLGELFHALSEVGELRVEVLDLGGQFVDVFGPVFPGLLVCGQLCVAPALVFGLRSGLLHELDDQVLDHLFDLDERICRRALGDHGEHLAPRGPRPPGQEGHKPLLQRARRVVAELRQRGPAARKLQQLGEVLLA
mmetsp:Transcript_124882/g.335189  ORF Transcript_124882/g.335189 Transcript_124882/m.335189 type:complete len:296 (-) Transcript_124882:1218-2105(-)